MMDNDDGVQDHQLLMLEEEKDDIESQQIAQFQNRMNQRTQQINNVTSSITNIHEIFQNLNDLVKQQGQTLNKFEDNIGDSKENTKETVNELKQALQNESPTLSERVTQPAGSDLSTTCVLIWFFFALLMFLIDFHSEQNAQMEENNLLMNGQNLPKGNGGPL